VHILLSFTSHDLALGRPVTEISAGTAAIAVTAALAAGWYVAKWHTAELDEISVRARLAGAVRLVWAARKAMAVVVVAGVILVDLWFKGKGR
jgi:hypothetical protein